MDSLDKIFENKSPSEISTMLINLNKFQLNSKKHIKKYNKLRKLHGEIIDSMENYILDDKYNMNDYFNSIYNDIHKEIPELDFYLDFDDVDDRTILNDLFMYRNHPKLKSITEIYLQKNKFRNEEKIKMLNSMKNSYVGLFKVIAADRNDGYITYEDVFTKKIFKVIDIAMSSTLKIDKKRMLYAYNRIITFDDISFGTGIHCIMSSNHKLLKEFIKNHKYNKYSDFSRCLFIYDLSKKENDLTISYNNQYGYRR
jgi:hypothetical protein